MPHLGPHFTYLQMITEAISYLKEGTGSSEHAIAKFIEEHYEGGTPQNFRRKLKLMLKKYVNSRKLVKIKNSYKMPVAESKIEKKGKIKERKKPKKVRERSATEIMDDLTQIQEELDEVNKRTLVEMRKVKQKYEKKVWEEEAEKKCGDTLMLWNCIRKRKKIIKLIPNFWSTAFLGLPSLRKLLTEEDKKIMGYLKTVDVSDCLHVKSGFTITFKFEQNPFFENVKLSREFSFSHEGIIDTSGTKIKWKDRGVSTGPEADVIEKGSEQSSTDVHKSDCSFLAWFSDDLAKDQDRDEVAEKIAYSLWPNAPEYFKDATSTSVSMAAVKHVDENGLPISDNTTKCHHRKGALVNTKLKELMEVHAEFVKAKEAALRNRWDLVQKYDLEVEVEEKVLRKQKREVCRSIYDRRSETIKDIPYFWLNAFISHGALADILSEEDRKIFRYLESVNVEETENPTLVYTITLNFNKGNPYFENASLRNTFSVEGVGTKGCTIKWKDNVGNGQGYPGDGNASFFTWFCGCGYVSEGNLDEVAEVIVEDLWPNAINYYFNGNRDCKKESAIVKDCRLWAASISEA